VQTTHRSRSAIFGGAEAKKIFWGRDFGKGVVATSFKVREFWKNHVVPLFEKNTPAFL
jgi:hypothetical protein